MIDTSDGLSTDLSHICEESGVGAEIEAMAIPRACVGSPRQEVDLDLALHGGEDYELLFTVRPGKKIPKQIAGVKLSEVGKITRQKTVRIRSGEGGVSRLVPAWLAALRAVAPRAALTIRKEARAPKPE